MEIRGPGVGITQSRAPKGRRELRTPHPDALLTHFASPRSEKSVIDKLRYSALAPAETSLRPSGRTGVRRSGFGRAVRSFGRLGFRRRL